MSSATGDRNDFQPSTTTCIESSKQPCRHFEFSELLLATDNFSESLVIGRGGFGKVYKGNVLNGSTVTVAAIKRLDPMSSQGPSEFWPEVDMLSNFRHSHLVSLFGYCNHENEMILVYEYMPNKTLDDHLHKLGTPLSWLQRLNICIGAARGLNYLHTGTWINGWAIHRDVKSSNILLNGSWDAKISDFGLSKKGPTNQPVTYVETLVKGTFGYLDPDYTFTGRLTRKSDVFAFGVVLLEVLCRKPALDLSLDEEQQNLATWAQESIKKGKLKHIIDSSIRDQISPKSLKEFVRIARRCLHDKQKERPTMAEVVLSLESVQTLQRKMNSLQPSHITILGRMVDKFSFTPIIGKSGKIRFGRTVVSRPPNLGISPFTERSQSCRKFEFPEILLATNNFDESLLIGKGGFGKVYKGNITYASTVAVAAIKRLDSGSRQGEREFFTEVCILSNLHHDHVVSLFGYCNHKKEMIIVYEYIPNGTLEDHLHKLSTPLSWIQRLKICIGAAYGLDYLHTGTGIRGVIHRDVKSSNILLHDTWAAKISDFGLSNIGPRNQAFSYVSTLVRGTIGYLDPTYYRTLRLSRKSDVYSFGVVLLEVLCRKRALFKSLDGELEVLSLWARDNIKKGRLKNIVDSDIRGQISRKCLRDFGRIALRCLLSNPEKRPTMSEVVFSLDSVLTLQEKTNSSLQAVGKTISGIMVDMLPFPSNVDNSALGDPKLSSNNISGYSGFPSSMFSDTREVDVDFGMSDIISNLSTFNDSEKVTRNVSQDLVLGEGASGRCS